MTDKVVKIIAHIKKKAGGINPFLPDEDGKNSDYESGRLAMAMEILQYVVRLQEESENEQKLSNIERTAKNLKEVSKRYALRQVMASTDTQLTEQAYLSLRLFNGYDLAAAHKDGAEWKEEQFENNRLKHCDSITKEQAELEQGFVDQHIEKFNRMPTFLDAIEYGMNLQREQMMAKAFDFTKEHNTACILASECLRNHGWFNRERDFNGLFRHLSCVDELFEGKFSGKTKVIVIKED